MKRGTTKSPAVGRRVEIPAYCDLWMRGARFGEPNPFNAPGVTDDAARDMLAEALDRHFGA